MSDDGAILTAPPGALRERPRKPGQMSAKYWDMPDGRVHFKASNEEVHYMDSSGDLRTRRLRFVNEGNGIIAARDDARKIVIDINDLRWRLIHRDGTELRSRIARIDNAPIDSLPNVTVNQIAPGIIEVPGISTDTVWRLALTPGGVVESFWLFSDDAPRDWMVELVGLDISSKFKLQQGHGMCVENLAQSEGRSVTESLHRWLEINDFGGPEVSMLPDGRQRIRIRKRWTGRVSNVDPINRTAHWEDLPAAYPVKIT